MKGFKRLYPRDIANNPFALLDEDWGLVTAGTSEKCNMMTISWGGLGVMWNKPVAYTFIRPQRYTYEFLEEGDRFSICFFDDDYRSALRFCGTKSGRHCDKVKETGLTLAFTRDGTPFFEEAKLVLVCKKMYAQFLNEESVIDQEAVLQHYHNDYHKMYISEIVDVLAR